jgi:hypothetical protein
VQCNVTASHSHLISHTYKQHSTNHSHQFICKKKESSQRLYTKCLSSAVFVFVVSIISSYAASIFFFFYTAAFQGRIKQDFSGRRGLRPVLRPEAVALGPAALRLVAVAAVPGGRRHGPARHRQLQGPLRRPRLRRAVLRRRVLLLRRGPRARRRGRHLEVAAVRRRRAPRVQPVLLQVALHLVIRQPVHLHQLPDLLRRGNCRDTN